MQNWISNNISITHEALVAGLLKEVLR
jgi:hypothetical protein